jgi:hypothetical protein
LSGVEPPGDPRKIRGARIARKGGAKLHRGSFGKAVENLTGSGEYQGMAGNFLKYGTEECSMNRRIAAAIGRLTTQILQLQTEMREGFSAIREEFHRDLDALGNQMRVLHEDVVARLKLTHEQGTEGRVSRKGKRR